MSVVYKCRHCGHKIGELPLENVDHASLGIDQLTSEDRRKMVHYDEGGHMQIQAICDHCEDSLKQHPNYHELDFFIQ